MAKIGIVGALGLEIEIIKNNLQNRKTYNYAKVTYYTGEINNHNITLVACGVGKVNAAIYTQILIDKFDIEYVFHTGIAGGMNSSLNKGDLVVADSITYHDVRPSQMKSLFPNQEEFMCATNLIELIKHTCKDKIPYQVGKIVTGDSFISDTVIKNKIVEYYSPKAVEMEGAAVAHCCYVNSVPFAVLRCISDNADDNAEFDYAEFEKLAADRAATVVLGVISRI